MKTNTKTEQAVVQQRLTDAGMQSVVHGANGLKRQLMHLSPFRHLGGAVRVASVLGLIFAGAAHAQACSVQAQEARSQAMQAEQQYEWQRAFELQRSFAQACPSFASYYKQAELAVRAKQYAPASAAYHKAYELAGSDDEKALAIGRNAEVYLKLGGDQDQERQALAQLKSALKQHSEPKPPWLVKLTIELDRKLEKQNVSENEYRSALRGLGSGTMLSQNTTQAASARPAPVAEPEQPAFRASGTRGFSRLAEGQQQGEVPTTPNPSPNPNVSSGANSSANSGNSPESDLVAVAKPASAVWGIGFRPMQGESNKPESMDVRLNFKYDSVEMDDASYDKLVALAKVLRERETHKGRTIWFVGHSDVRGSRSYNLKLSLQRAKAAYEQVVAMWPELEGRIKFRGMGENEPLYTKPSFPGANKEMHRMNRRLEVFFAPAENTSSGAQGNA